MTYCDKDCRNEHWNKVHHRDCKFLSGIKQVENSRHREESCNLCIDKKLAKEGEILNAKSPKTGCHIELMMQSMKKDLGSYFEFHAEGKTCRCSLDICCELPFPLGEVSGQYVGKGLDEMFAHAIKIGHAMINKYRNEDGGQHETLTEAIRKVTLFRSALWGNTLVNDIIVSIDEKLIHECLSDPVNGFGSDLEAIYGSTNAWWKALVTTVDLIVFMNSAVNSALTDLSCIEGPKFKNLKQFQGFLQSMNSNQIYVHENNLWSKFKLWPTLAGDALMILLPDGYRCITCDSSLNGEVKVRKGGNQSLPNLIPRIGENGRLVAFCSIVTNPKCQNDWIIKYNSVAQIDHIEEENNFYSKGRFCDFCLKISFSSHRCDCLASQYCSTECQGKDLKFHRTVCSTWANDKFRKLISSKEPKKVENWKTLQLQRLQGAKEGGILPKSVTSNRKKNNIS